MKVLVPKTFDFVDVVWCMYMADNCTDLRCVLCNIAFRRLHYDYNHYTDHVRSPWRMYLHVY